MALCGRYTRDIITHINTELTMMSQQSENRPSFVIENGDQYQIIKAESLIFQNLSSAIKESINLSAPPIELREIAPTSRYHNTGFAQNRLISMLSQNSRGVGDVDRVFLEGYSKDSSVLHFRIPSNHEPRIAKVSPRIPIDAVQSPEDKASTDELFREYLFHAFASQLGVGMARPLKVLGTRVDESGLIRTNGIVLSDPGVDLESMDTFLNKGRVKEGDIFSQFGTLAVLSAVLGTDPIAKERHIAGLFGPDGLPRLTRIDPAKRRFNVNQRLVEYDSLRAESGEHTMKNFSWESFERNYFKLGEEMCAKLGVSYLETSSKSIFQQAAVNAWQKIMGLMQTGFPAYLMSGNRQVGQEEYLRWVWGNGIALEGILRKSVAR